VPKKISDLETDIETILRENGRTRTNDLIRKVKKLRETHRKIATNRLGISTVQKVAQVSVGSVVNHLKKLETDGKITRKPVPDSEAVTYELSSKFGNIVFAEVLRQLVENSERIWIAVENRKVQVKTVCESIFRECDPIQLQTALDFMADCSEQIREYLKDNEENLS
jgi:DNA-binding PadR family transcriptional regulator